MHIVSVKAKSVVLFLHLWVSRTQKIFWFTPQIITIKRKKPKRRGGANIPETTKLLCIVLLCFGIKYLPLFAFILLLLVSFLVILCVRLFRVLSQPRWNFRMSTWRGDNADTYSSFLWRLDYIVTDPLNFSVSV